MSSALAKFKCWTLNLGAFPLGQEKYFTSVHLVDANQIVLFLGWVWAELCQWTGISACWTGQWVPAQMAREKACSELLTQQIVLGYVWIECCERGGQSVLSQSSTIVRISYQMFLIQAQNLLSCPQGKSRSMLLSVTAPGPVSSLQLNRQFSKSIWCVSLLPASPDYWHFKKSSVDEISDRVCSNKRSWNSQQTFFCKLLSLKK